MVIFRHMTLCNDNLERSYIHFTTTNIYFTGAMYNSTFLIIYKPSSLIISPWTFSMQLGAGTSLFCLSQCAIPFCTLSAQQVSSQTLVFIPIYYHNITHKTVSN